MSEMNDESFMAELDRLRAENAVQAALIDDLQGQIKTAHRVYGDEVESLRLENGVRLERIQMQAARIAAQAARIDDLKNSLANSYANAEAMARSSDKDRARIKELESQDFYVRLSEENDRLHERIAALTAERDALRHQLDCRS